MTTFSATVHQNVYLPRGSSAVHAILVRPPDVEKGQTEMRTSIRIWPVDPLAAALQRKPRELTAEERRRFAIGQDEN